MPLTSRTAPATGSAHGRTGWRTALLALALTASGTLAAQTTAPRDGDPSGTGYSGNATQQPLGLSQSQPQSQAQDDTNTPGTTGPIRLRMSAAAGATNAAAEPPILPGQVAPYVASEFERFVQDQSGSATPVRRFGANLVTDAAGQAAYVEPLPAVPGDYVVKPGDEIALTLWGTVEADLRLTVDRTGRISVPRVGTFVVAGVRHADLPDAIRRQVSQVFKNFQLAATLGRVRPVRVFVTGFVQRPGSMTVSGLSSVLHVLMSAGGPSGAGSFRDITLRRGGKVLAHFDLYDLLLRGDRGTDEVVQPDDVIHVGPVGTQVGLLGSVNQQAVFELNPGETLADLLRMAGGFNAVADRSRVAIERLSDRSTGRVVEVMLPGRDTAAQVALGAGDLVRVFSAISSALPKERQNKRVRVEGEVVRPGDYVLPPGSTIADALRAAGGLTRVAYVFGTEFTRESVRLAQEANFDRALRDLDIELARTTSSRRTTTAEEAGAQTASVAANTRLIERLRQVHPNGRVVLQIGPDATVLPDMPLEDGDRLSIPTQGTSVGVFGSVFNTGSFVYVPNRTLRDYLRLAGGPTRGADAESIFVVRANGTVVSARQDASFWHAGNAFNNAASLPGDTIFVPEEMNKTLWIQDAKDWTQILYQFGLGVAAFKTLGL